MPEDAPVIRTTFPATFSLVIYLLMQLINLKTRNNGKKRSSSVNVIGGSTMFMTL
jgi:hypothetical protein